jgi:hypothetical protein
MFWKGSYFYANMPKLVVMLWTQDVEVLGAILFVSGLLLHAHKRLNPHIKAQ